MVQFRVSMSKKLQLSKANYIPKTICLKRNLILCNNKYKHSKLRQLIENLLSFVHRLG